MRWVIVAMLAGAVASRAPQPPSSPITSKALYGGGVLRHFELADYRGVVAGFEASVAIASVDTGAAHASGVILADGLVLTARHAVFRGSRLLEPSTLCVVRSVDGERFPVRAFASSLALRSRKGHPLDAVLLAVGTAERPLVGANAARVDLAPVPLDTPVVLIGHPHGHAVRAADEGYVRFPHRPSYAALRELLGRERARPTARRHPDEVRDEILASYVPDGQGGLRSASKRFGGHPVLGLEIDAVQGMSGGGVYDKRSGALVGILFDGQPDTPAPWNVCWGRHEAAVPIAEIVRALHAEGVDLAALGVAFHTADRAGAATQEQHGGR